jgi:hypothetical protein
MDPPPQEPGCFARFLEHIPGYTWLRIKLGRLILGPTYRMPPRELEEYFTLAEQERLAEKATQKEADLEVQKVMAKGYPDYYFKSMHLGIQLGVRRGKGICLFLC